MQLKPYLEKLNPRLIFIHFVAFWMFTYAFSLFSYLINIPLFKAVLYNNDALWEKAIEMDKSGSNLTTFYIDVVFFGPVIGQLTALIISLIIVIRKKWFWLNSVIAFIAIVILARFDLTGWAYLKHIFLSPGELNAYNPYFYAITNGSVLLSLGLLLFFLRKIQAFIQRHNTRPKAITTGSLKY